MLNQDMISLTHTHSHSLSLSWKNIQLVHQEINSPTDNGKLQHTKQV